MCEYNYALCSIRITYIMCVHVYACACVVHMGITYNDHTVVYSQCAKFQPHTCIHYMHVSYVWDQDSLYKIISSDIFWAKRITHYFPTEGKYSGEEESHTVLSWGSFYSLRLASMHQLIAHGGVHIG